MDTSDWAKNLVERKKKELVRDDKLDAQLDKKWAEVCQAAQKAVAEVNKEMDQEYIRFSQDANADKFSLRVGERRMTLFAWIGIIAQLKGVAEKRIGSLSLAILPSGNTIRSITPLNKLLATKCSRPSRVKPG
jgi:hypothetical protein